MANRLEPVYVVYEDDYVSCFLDHEPFNEGHALILPKRHVVEADELDIDTASAIMNASILLSKALKLIYKPDGITIIQNGGIFNELTHYHMHVVPRYENQQFGNFYSDEPQDFSMGEGNLLETKNMLKEAIHKLKN